MDPYQTEGDYPRCACGELLLGPEELTYGVCKKCADKEMEERR